MTTTYSNSAIIATELDQRIHNLIAGKTDFFCFQDGMGRLLKVNSYFLTLFQLEKDALLILGKTNTQLAESFPLHKKMFLSFAKTDELCWKTGDIFSTEQMIDLPDHTENVFAITKIPILTDGTRQGMIVIGKNINERKELHRNLIKHADHLLMKNEQHWRNILINMPIMMDAIDENGNFLLWNKECEVVSGYKAEEIIGNPNVWSMLYPSTLPYSQFFQQIENASITRGIEHPLMCKDGSIKKIVWSSLSAKHTINDWKVWGFGTDVTQMRITEKTLKHREKELKTILDNVPDVISRFNQNFQHTYVNQAIEETSGLPPSAFIGKTCEELDIDPSYKEFWPQHIQKVFETKEKATVEYDYNSPLGLRHYQSLLMPEFDEQKGVESVLRITRDLTEKKDMQNELARLDRLNLVGEMAASIGHEVRNPLTTVRGFLQMLMLKKPCIQFKEEFSLMIEEIDRANAIVNNHKMNLQLAIVPDVFVDEKEIRQLILNLVRNAFDAMCQCGILTISTYEEEDFVVLTVKDTGPGISDAIKDKIGAPFITTKETGTGLGLPVCYSIVEKHHAKMSFDSSTKGTIFYLKFKKVIT